MFKRKNYYPVNLDIEGKKALVVGGGEVAERKIKTLLNFGARVVAIAPSFTAGISRLAGKIKLVRRKYKKSDIQGATLVIAATDNLLVNRKISNDAKQNKILVNVIDQPKLCSFIAPAVIKQGPLVVSISTSGETPAFAKALRLRLEKMITPKLGRKVTALGKRRRSRLGIAPARA